MNRTCPEAVGVLYLRRRTPLPNPDPAAALPETRTSGVRRSPAAQPRTSAIVGYWTLDYVRRKLALYREARVTNLILCIDDARACDAGVANVKQTVGSGNLPAC
jgi:hypothetical protein